MNASEQRQMVRESKLTEAGIPLSVLDVEGVTARTEAMVEGMRAAGYDDDQISKVTGNDYLMDTCLFDRNLTDSEIDEMQDALDEMGIY